MARIALSVVLLFPVAAFAGEPDKANPRAALLPLQSLIGTWKGTGVPEGTREEKQSGFWTETATWEWRFKGDDGWMQATFDKGKHFASAELRALPKANRFRLTVCTPDKTTLTFEGDLQDQRLVLDRVDGATKETQRLTFRLLHFNRFTYQYDVKPDGKTLFAKKYQVGATKEGEPFAASGSSDPECVVSGGKGTIAVSHAGKTYYVCCSGCRDEFKANPEKYVKEYEAKKKAKKD
jgi:YHS domain-containing protein